MANPISDSSSVPFQANWEDGVAPDNDTRFILNIQPVVPFTLGENWNLIARVIVPLVSQPPLFEGAPATFGVSDILASAFFSPAQPKAAIWGGPAISLPSSSDPFLGAEKWSAHRPSSS